MYIKFTIEKTMNPYSVIDQQKNHGAPYIVNLLMLNFPHPNQNNSSNMYRMYKCSPLLNISVHF